MALCATQDHEKATADPSAAPQDDSARGRRCGLFSGQILPLHCAQRQDDSPLQELTSGRFRAETNFE